MAREHEFRSKDKKVQRMTRDGLVEQNKTTGEELRISQRGQEFQLRQMSDSADVPLREERSHTGRTRSHVQPHDVGQESTPSPIQQYDTHTAGEGDAPQSDTLPHTANDAPVTSSPGHSSIHPQYEGRGSLREDARQPAADTSTLDQPPAPPQPVEDLPLDPLQPERPGRLRFDAATSATIKGRQHGSKYARKFAKSVDPASAPEQSTDGTSPDSSASAAGNTTASEQSAPDSDAEPQPGKKSLRLHFGAEELPPDDVPDRKISKLQGKVEKTDAKLERAKAALPTKRKKRTERTFDTEKGKPQRKIYFEQEVKSQREHLKGALPSRPIKAGANAAVGFAHSKISQVEHENVEVEAAHKGELIAERAARRGYRLHKTAPYRRVEKLSRTAARQHTKLTYQEALRDNPKLRSNMVSRFVQKQKIKRQYAKAARETKRAAQAAKKTGTAAANLSKAVGIFAKQHPAAFGIIAGVLLLIFLMVTMFGSCSSMAGGVMSGVLSGSYLAEDKEIDNAEKAYTEWETDLQLQIDNVELDYPGYDEYRFDLDEIGHDPFVLLAYLTAKYRDYTFSEVQAELLDIFSQQYTLTFDTEVEVRYDDEGDPYNWYILNVALTVKPLPEILAGRMDAEQKEIYDTLVDTKGNRQYSLNPFAFDWLPYVTSEYGWRVHPISGAKDFHPAVDIGVPEGTPILAGHDGIVSTASYDADGYGYYITLQGANGLSTRYAHCSTLLVSVGQTVKKGESIAKSGNTGNSTGPHLHFEVMMNGQSLNPLFFAVTGVADSEEM